MPLSGLLNYVEDITTECSHKRLWESVHQNDSRQTPQMQTPHLLLKACPLVQLSGVAVDEKTLAAVHFGHHGLLQQLQHCILQQKNNNRILCCCEYMTDSKRNTLFSVATQPEAHMETVIIIIIMNNYLHLSSCEC